MERRNTRALKRRMATRARGSEQLIGASASQSDAGGGSEGRSTEAPSAAVALLAGSAGIVSLMGSAGIVSLVASVAVSFRGGTGTRSSPVGRTESSVRKVAFGRVAARDLEMMALGESSQGSGGWYVTAMTVKTSTESTNAEKHTFPSTLTTFWLSGSSRSAAAAEASLPESFMAVSSEGLVELGLGKEEDLKTVGGVWWSGDLKSDCDGEVAATFPANRALRVAVNGWQIRVLEEQSHSVLSAVPNPLSDLVGDVYALAEITHKQDREFNRDEPTMEEKLSSLDIPEPDATVELLAYFVEASPTCRRSCITIGLNSNECNTAIDLT
ncbi:hypothetical protein C4D60_Mb06t02980 [Musa balbisiana]|uniref:Uncharacterized protein n=1 Tax=Musa balbisiana TaxID=52838 RepID=A0A4V4H3M5_MUSBA|nr:hypothetical protein C4D60_Mb06t02980 [Musa balbisiana]